MSESTAIAAKPHEPAYAEPEGRSVEVGAACDGLDHESSVCIGLLCGGRGMAVELQSDFGQLNGPCALSLPTLEIDPTVRLDGRDHELSLVYESLSLYFKLLNLEDPVPGF